MGFYGNISNVNKSTFQFDKIYPNRAAMEQFCNSDGIFVGRYVLVDYNLDTSATDIKENKIPNSKVSIGYDFYTLNPRGQKELVHWANGGPVLFSGAGSDVPYYGFGGTAINEGDYILVVGSIIQKITIDFPPIYGDEESNPHINAEDIFELALTPSLYICESIDENNYPKFELVLDSSVDNIYILNHKIDSQLYGEAIGRGWDSTVWQKTYKDGQICYVMVAELNSVVPTFDISADAPTAVPLVPHWGSDSSNVYYKLHMQPQWGFRIKESKKGEFTSDNAVYPSDVTGDFITSVSINDSTKALVSDSYESNLAIYFNKNGFDKNIESSLAGDLKRQHLTINEDDVKDTIKISPTGYSGNKYNKHPGAGVEKAIDTYELSLLLPSLGTSISEMWNMIYGKGTSRDARGRLLYNKETGLFATEDENGKVDLDNALRNTNIVWNNINGHRLINTINGIDYEYNSELIDSLAAGINTVHDLIGQIIIDTETNFNNVDNWDPTKIYYINNKFYQKYQEYISTNDQYQKVSGKVVENLNGYYREDIHEFPDLSDEKILTDSEKRLGKTSYSNYINAVNDTKIIDGAIYYTINDLPETDISSQLLLTKPTENEDSLYKKVKNENIISYKKVSNLEDQSLNSETGEYFKITSTAVAQEEFYIPNRYYIAIASSENGEFNKIIQCTEQNLVTAKAAAGITSDTPTTSYQFYRGITKVNDATTGVWIIDESNPIIRKNVSLPENHYLYDTENKKLTIFGDTEQDVLYEIFDDSSKKEHINFKADPINPNSLIIDSYDAFTYEVEGDNINSWTLWEIYSKNQNLGENEKIIIKKDSEDNYVQAYGLKRGTAPTTYSLQDAVLVNNLVDFEENKYYYHDNAYDEYILETLDGLKTEQGYAKNINHLYCTISAVSVGVYYSIIESLYYQNTSADWIRETAVKINANDAGKTYKQSDPTQIEHNSRYYKLDNLNLTRVGELNLFKLNVYYDVGGNLINEYINGIDYYKKTNGYKIQWTAKELPQIATSLNTMLGLILRTNRMLADGDELTRNRATVQGAINSLNDVIDKFESIINSSVLMVNDLGKISSGNIKGDNWITIGNVISNNNTHKPELSITHTKITQTNTASNIDLNNSDTNLIISKPIIDSTGHVTGQENQTVTLPYGYKKVQADDNNVTTVNNTETMLIKGNNLIETSINNNAIEISNKEILASNLKLGNYDANYRDSEHSEIVGTDTVSQAFAKLNQNYVGVGIESEATSEDKTYWGLCKWIKEQIEEGINSTTIETNFWGIQVPTDVWYNGNYREKFAISSDVSDGVFGNAFIIPLNNTDSSNVITDNATRFITYGYSNRNYEIVNNGMQIKQQAMYRIQGSLAIETDENIDIVEVQIFEGQSNWDKMNFNNVRLITSITESFESPATNAVIGLPAKLVELRSNNVIYLVVKCSKVSNNLEAKTINILMNNDSSYVLIEKVENLLFNAIYEWAENSIIPENAVLPDITRHKDKELVIAPIIEPITNAIYYNSINNCYETGTYILTWNVPEQQINNSDIYFIGTWSFTRDESIPLKYAIKYVYNNVTDDNEISESLPYPEIQLYENGENVKMTFYPEPITVDDKKWYFAGWENDVVTINNTTTATGNWKYVEVNTPLYKINYTYSGSSLPQQVWNTLPEDNLYHETGEVVYFKNPTNTQIDVDGTRYIFNKWEDPSSPYTIQDYNITTYGIWDTHTLWEISYDNIWHRSDENNSTDPSYISGEPDIEFPVNSWHLEGESITLPTYENIYDEGYDANWVFDGWKMRNAEEGDSYLNNNFVMPNSDMDIAGYWHAEPKKYAVRYYYDGDGYNYYNDEFDGYVTLPEGVLNTKPVDYGNHIRDEEVEPQMPSNTVYIDHSPDTYDIKWTFNEWDKSSLHISQNEESNYFVGTWSSEQVEKTWPIVYRYEGVYPESARLPNDTNTYGNSDTPVPVDPPETSIVSIEDNDLRDTTHGYASGTWTFNGWTWTNPDAHDTNPIFTGSWNFVQDTSIPLKYKIMYEYKGVDSQSNIINLSDNAFESSILQSYYTLDDVLLDSDIPSRDAEIKIGNNLYTFRNWATSNRSDSNRYDDISTKLDDNNQTPIGSYFYNSYGDISNWPSILTIYGIYQIPEFTISLYKYKSSDESESLPNDLKEWSYVDDTVYPYHYEITLPSVEWGGQYTDADNKLWIFEEWRDDHNNSISISDPFYITESINKITGYWTLVEEGE